ncbi:glycerol kinase [Pseudoalteromonas ulvae UL12]|uniref:glycerol kinase GlpK n=1 Tax=Pseudoalteromonas ulvae TaxID=107327 RepID=UPI00186B8E47|nr:glycerol kinase GlpK [Pseudoalteromonas ulvae]MBE0362019.1 glycerol kinase [Pseudoalteromonas ulvae UL12]
MTHTNNKQYIIALDQGTTSSRTIIFNRNAEVVSCKQREFTQHYPQAGWVEHDPMEIWASQSSTLIEALASAGIHSDEVAALGITNQRETTVIWDKHTGKPIHNAIVWQCRRSNDICQELKRQGHQETIGNATGLVLDPYFSASKIKWLLDTVPNAREQAERGQLLFGTIDTWLLWKLTEGKVHATDPTNASRTMLYNIHQQAWDPQLLTLFDIPACLLPQVLPSSAIYGTTRIAGEGSEIKIAGIAGDQQAALFGHGCTTPGSAKNTYGTGCFLLMNTGTQAVKSNHGLLTTIAIGAQGEINYALEGAVFMGGATIQWLRDELGLIRDAKDTEYFASQVEDTQGVYLIPAFVGLGAPHWDPDARGALIGLTRGTNRNHIIRAALEAIAYQSQDLLQAMCQDSQLQLHELSVDGGAVNNHFLMQFQADISEVKVLKPSQTETTALGAAFLAGLAVGFWSDMTEIMQKVDTKITFDANMSAQQRHIFKQGWRDALSRVTT